MRTPSERPMLEGMFPALSRATSYVLLLGSPCNPETIFQPVRSRPASSDQRSAPIRLAGEEAVIGTDSIEEAMKFTIRRGQNGEFGVNKRKIT